MNQQPTKEEMRKILESDLWSFARVINPRYVYGDIHRRIYKWMQDYSLFGRGKGKTANKLVMLPRAHLKSHMVATWCAWIIAKHPEITILYVSATAGLAEAQLYSIKNILTSTQYRKYWPDMVHEDEGKREQWSATKIKVDHPKRKLEGIRDATIATAGLTTNTTGWHADIIVSDDIVVPENAYTQEGRESVAKKTSQFTSIRNAGGFTLACGTRYHPSDIYDTWKSQKYDIWKGGEVVERKNVWEIMEFPVETDGEFLWPRTVGQNNKAFGFDNNELSRIKAEYIDSTQFYAQYYNNPNDPDSHRLTQDKFQYYDRKYLTNEGSTWYFNNSRLNVYAAIDFAFSLNKRADYTAIVVIGIAPDGYIYVLDIERFKSDKVSEYYEKLIRMHEKWQFKKLRAEVTVAQQIIVNDIKDKMRENGYGISIDEYRPNRYEGSKEERIAAVLEPRYDQQMIWHFKGGYTNILEEELLLARPPHDDVKDAMANAVEIAVKPKQTKQRDRNNVVQFNSRFGGISYGR